MNRDRTSVEDFCNKLHRTIAKEFKYALVWGSSVKHQPQKVGIEHLLNDEDVVQIVTKTVKQQQQDKNYTILVQGFNEKHAKKRLEAKKQKQARLRG